MGIHRETEREGIRILAWMIHNNPSHKSREPPDHVETLRLVPDTFGGEYEGFVLITLSTIGAILHVAFMWKLVKLAKSTQLTTRLLWLSSSCQVIYIMGIGIPGITQLIFEEWIFGWIACRVFLSLKTITSGLCINVTAAIIAEKMFGVTFPLRRYQCVANRYYQASIIITIIAIPFISGLPRFYLAGTVVDVTSNKTECVGHVQMSDMSHVMHLCWCIYVLVLFFIVPICVSLSCAGVLWYGAAKKKKKKHVDEVLYSEELPGNKKLDSTYSVVSSETCSTLAASIVSSASRLQTQKSTTSRLRRLALYTIIDTVVFLICWGPLHLSGAFFKLIQ